MSVPLPTSPSSQSRKRRFATDNAAINTAATGMPNTTLYTPTAPVAMQISAHPIAPQQQPQTQQQQPSSSSSSSSVPPPAPWQPRSLSLYSRTDKLTLIGEGTYGSVFLAKSPTGQLVALKKIRKEKKEGFPITAIREIKILKRVDHPNIVKLHDVVSSHTYTPHFKDGDVFMVFEFCDHDLTGLMESRAQISDAQVKYYMKCILEGLYYLHKDKIMHRDIKGANILISNNGAVKIADFGLARIMNKQSGYTNRVVTLWYRAPELLLGMSDYSSKIDLWALGCLFAELITRGAVLFPGNNTDLDQLNRIYEHIGTPNESNWPGVTKLKYYKQFEPKPRERTLHKLFTNKCTPKAFDLLDKLLTLDPNKRISAKDALNHDYFYTELPPMMLAKDHPKYHQNFHEYHSKRRRQGRQQTAAQAASQTTTTTTAQSTNTAGASVSAYPTSHPPSQSIGNMNAPSQRPHTQYRPAQQNTANLSSRLPLPPSAAPSSQPQTSTAAPVLSAAAYHQHRPYTYQPKPK